MTWADTHWPFSVGIAHGAPPLWWGIGRGGRREGSEGRRSRCGSCRRGKRRRASWAFGGGGRKGGGWQSRGVNFGGGGGEKRCLAGEKGERAVESDAGLRVGAMGKRRKVKAEAEEKWRRDCTRLGGRDGLG